MNVTLAVLMSTLCFTIFCACRFFLMDSHLVENVHGQLASISEQLRLTRKGYEYLAMEIIKMEDRLVALRIELMKKNKPKTKKATTKKAPKKTKKCPEITVDAIAIEEIK